MSASLAMTLQHVLLTLILLSHTFAAKVEHSAGRWPPCKRVACRFETVVDQKQSRGPKHKPSCLRYTAHCTS